MGMFPLFWDVIHLVKTIEETQKNLKDAIRVYIESIAKEKESIPQDSSFESFQTIVLSKEYA